MGVAYQFEPSRLANRTAAVVPEPFRDVRGVLDLILQKQSIHQASERIV